jgi:hypothetical protein
VPAFVALADGEGLFVDRGAEDRLGLGQAV